MLKSLLVSIGILLSFSALAQESDSTAKPETFELEWAGEKHVMQKYFIVFLKSGPERLSDEKEVANLQQEHLMYLGNLYEKGIIALNGPTDGKTNIRGFSVYTVATLEEAKKLASEDPMVKAKHLAIEVHPWWLAKGSGVK